MYQKYEHYTLEELASDPYFQSWVLTSTEDVEEFWRGFMYAYPHKSELVSEAKELVLGVHAHFKKKEISLSKKHQYFDHVLKTAAHTQTRYPRRNITFWAIAASVLLVLSSGILFWTSSQEEVISHATDYGEWKTVLLPDGSSVNLNANSEVSFASEWEEGETREVWLEGEAYFDVVSKKKTGTQFIVYSSDVSVEVLGTKFNVYQRGDETEVYLEEGKIKLAAQNEETLLEMGDVITYSAKERKITTRQKALDNTRSSWKDGTLIMEGVRPQEALEKLEQLYGVKFIMKNHKKQNIPTQLKVPMDELDIVLSMLEKAWTVQIHREQDQVIIE